MDSSAFERRAALYERLDAELAPQTRFFGAACATNRVLGHLSRSAGSAACSRPTWHFLIGAGAVLEGLNVALAQAVREGRLAGPDLDDRIVSLEQQRLDEALRRLPCDHRRQLFAQLNAHLNLYAAAACLHLNREVRWYCRALGTVRRSLRAPLDFAALAHREAIGLELIARLRRVP